MINLTKQEKTVLIFVASVLLFGSLLSVIFKKYPELSDVVNLIDSNKLYEKVDVNVATIEELVAIPYIGEYTAKNIVSYRQKHGRFNYLRELKNVKGIRDKNYEIFSDYLIIDGQYK